VERCFAPDVAFHAVVPGTGSFRERAGAAETANQLRLWLGDADPLELLEHSVEPIVDRLRLSYRFAASEDEQWHIVEQQAYAVVGERGIEKLDLVLLGISAGSGTAYRGLVERAASRQPFRPLTCDAGDQVEMLVVVEKRDSMIFGDRCDQEIDRLRTTVVAVAR
jgi:hypothetical protein